MHMGKIHNVSLMLTAAVSDDYEFSRHQPPSYYAWRWAPLPFHRTQLADMEFENLIPGTRLPVSAENVLKVIEGSKLLQICIDKPPIDMPPSLFAVNYFAYVPTDVTEEIFSELDIKDIASVSLVRLLLSLLRC